MGFQKGHKLAKGRPKGSVNKRTTVLEACESQGLDPFKEMAKIAMNSAHESNFDAIKELCQYLEPKKKAIEHTGNIDVRIQQELESLMKLSEEELLALIPKQKG